MKISSLRIHLVPLITLGGNPMGDSNWIVFRNIALTYAAQDWSVFLWLPHQMQEYVKDVSYKNVFFKFFDSTFDWYIETNRMPSELILSYSRRSGIVKDVCDLVVTSRAGGALYASSAMADFRFEDGKMPVMIHEAMVRDENPTSRLFLNIRSYAYANSYVWFLTEEERRKAYSMMSKTVAPIDIKRFKENYRIMGYGIDIEKMDKILDKYSKNEMFTVFFGARFSTEKRPELMYEIMSSFYQYGRPIKCIVNTQHTGSVHLQKFSKLFSFAFLEAGCPQNVYYQNAISSNVFICSSSLEGWPAGFWEQLYLIQIGIFPDLPWARANLPEWYPFVYKDAAEAYGMLKWIYENYDEALKKVTGIREYVRKNAHYDVIFSNLTEWTGEIVQKYRNIHVSASIRELVSIAVDNLLKKDNEFLLSDLVKEVVNESRGLSVRSVSNARFGSPSVYQIYLAAESNDKINQKSGVENTTFMQKTLDKSIS